MVSAPREKETLTPPPEQSQESPLARFTDSHGVTKEEEDPYGQEWLLSLTDHLDVMGPSKFRLLEGWMDFKEEEFSSVVTDALAAAGVNTADLPERWMTGIRKKRKKKVPTLPNLPPHLFVDKMASPRYQEPEDEWEWQIDIYQHHYNLTADDDTLDVLKKLPPIPCNPIFPEMVPQDAPDDDDDEAWTSEIYRRISSQTS